MAGGRIHQLSPGAKIQKGDRARLIAEPVDDGTTAPSKGAGPSKDGASPVEKDTSPEPKTPDIKEKGPPPPPPGS